MNSTRVTASISNILDSSNLETVSFLNDYQKEELRQRLYLVRNRLQSETSDEEYLSISNAFTNSAFKIFLSNAQTGLSSLEILNILKQGKSY